MKLGTRGSQLALWQARAVATALEGAGVPSPEIVVIRTTGDEAGTGLGPGGSTLNLGTTDRPPTLAGWANELRHRRAEANIKRLFVKELEEALLDGRIDAAVHSSKDMPAVLAPGLAIGATLAREDPRDALLLPTGHAHCADLAAVAAALGPSPRIGTGSVRRVAQLRMLFPEAVFSDVRGNVDTRLRKLDERDYDAIVLAAAGLLRLGHADRITWPFPIDQAVPAPGQGIVAVEMRTDRPDMAAMLAAINDRAAADALAAERALVHALGGGCQMPLGALAEIDGSTLRITGVVITPDGSRLVREVAHGARDEAAAVGVALAESLLRSGAGAILDAVRGRSQTPRAAP